MLAALSIADACAIAEAAQRWRRDEKAMLDYLGVGRRSRAPATLDATDLDAFDSPERRTVEALLQELSVEARRELIALVGLARAIGADFNAALRRARRIPPDAQVAYLLGRKLDDAIPVALEKLGLRM